MSHKLSLAILVLALVILSHSIHFRAIPLHLQSSNASTSSNPELDALRLQQSNFESSINGLVNNLTTVQNSLDNTTNNTEKVLILEKAIIRERQQVFKISNDIIPPFNLSKTACQQLTDAQKIAILNQINDTRAQIASLKQLAASVPACDEINSINADILKQ